MAACRSETMQVWFQYRNGTALASQDFPILLILMHLLWNRADRRPGDDSLRNCGEAENNKKCHFKVPITGYRGVRSASPVGAAFRPALVMRLDRPTVDAEARPYSATRPPQSQPLPVGAAFRPAPVMRPDRSRSALKRDPTPRRDCAFYCIAVSVAVAAASELKRMVPLASTKKWRVPVTFGVSGSAWTV